MLVPAQVVLECHSQVFSTIHFLQCLVMDSVMCLYRFAFGGYIENLAFQGVEFHEPIFLPLSKLFLYSMQSSANNLAVESGDMYSGRSFINRRKSRGPNTLPCGTPDWTEAEVEVVVSSRTCCDLFLRKLLIHLCRLLLS